jgi:conjugative relaxase-like TrwC/TraI family protein
MGMVTISNGTYGTAKEFRVGSLYYGMGGKLDAGIEFLGEAAKLLELDKFAPDAKSGQERANVIYDTLVQNENHQGEKLTPENMTGDRRYAYDVTFSPDKSVSIVHAFGTDQKRESIEAAQKYAVSSVMDFVEKNLIQARIQEDGVRVALKTGNMIAAMINHYDDRAGDMQFHTHIPILNMTMTDHGWRAISNEALTVNRALLIKLYNNALSCKLGESFSVEQSPEGYTRIKGVAPEVQELFSKRTRQIETEAKRLITENPKLEEGAARKIASETTRAPKKQFDPEKQHGKWIAELKEHGYRVEQIMDSVRSAERPRRRLTAEECIDKAVRSESVNNACYTRIDILREAADFSRGAVSPESLLKAFEDYRGHIRLAEIVTHTNVSEMAYTSKLNLEREKAVVRIAQELRGTREEVLHLFEAEKFVSEKFTPSQLRGYRAAVMTTDGVSLIQGDAGTGKTTMLNQIREAYESKGYQVVGLAFTNVAKDAMIEEAKMDAYTIHRKENDLHEQSGKTVYILDEASMVGTRQAEILLQYVGKNPEARLIMIGDNKQIQSIEAGAVFRTLQEKGIATERMTDNVRQIEPEYKMDVDLMAARKTGMALDRMDRGGRMIEIRDQGRAVEYIRDEYLKKVYHHKACIVTTGTNEMRDGINNAVRDQMKKDGQIRDVKPVMVREAVKMELIEKWNSDKYRTQDVVEVFKPGNGLKAGESGRIVDVDRDSSRIYIRNESGKIKAVDLNQSAEQFSVYREVKKELGAGDRIIFTKKDNQLGFKNNQTALVKSIDGEGNVRVQLGKGEKQEQTFNLKDFSYFNYAHARTIDKSQAKTKDYTIAYLEAGQTARRETDYNMAYVGLSRGRYSAMVITNDKEALRESIKQMTQKATALEISEKQEQTKSRKQEKGMEQEKSRGPGIGMGM